MPWSCLSLDLLIRLLGELSSLLPRLAVGELKRLPQIV